MKETAKRAVVCGALGIYLLAGKFFAGVFLTLMAVLLMFASLSE